MKMFHDEIKDFESLIDYFDSNEINQIYKDVAIANYVCKYENSKEFDKNIYNINDLAAIDICKSLYIGVFKELFVGSATVCDTINSLYANIDKYREVYNILDDEISRKTYFNILMYRLVVQGEFLDTVRVEGIQYYRKELLNQNEPGILLDCGAYQGETAISYIETYGGDYKKIYMFEPTPENAECCKENLSAFDNIVVHNAGVGSEKGTIDFINDRGAGNRVFPGGHIKIPIVTIDDVIPEAVSFIKMDIEGCEMLALKGAKNHIINDKPQMAICLYHVLTDLFEIPLYIKKLNDKQRFNIRYHGRVGSPEEVVLYVEPFEITTSSLDEKTSLEIVSLLDSVLEATNFIANNYSIDDVTFNELIDCISSATKTIKSKIT